MKGIIVAAFGIMICCSATAVPHEERVIVHDGVQYEAVSLENALRQAQGDIVLGTPFVVNAYRVDGVVCDVVLVEPFDYAQGDKGVMCPCGQILRTAQDDKALVLHQWPPKLVDRSFAIAQDDKFKLCNDIAARYRDNPDVVPLRRC